MIDNVGALSEAPLAADLLGSDGPRIALAHGFTQNRGCWGGLAEALSGWARVLRVDLPGHGESSRVKASVEEGAEMLGTTTGPAHYVGYSMGGRHVLRLALDRPDLVKSAVLIGTHPGIEDAAARAKRRAWDFDMAARLEREGLASFLKHWLAMPLFEGLDPAAAGLDARIKNTVEGLAASLRSAGTGSQKPMWSDLDDVQVPLLFLAGERDGKYVSIGKRVRALGRRGIGAHVVADAGHAAHLERRDVVVDIIRRQVLTSE